MTPAKLSRGPGCLGAAFVALFVVGGLAVLVLHSVASPDPASPGDYDAIKSLASATTVLWVIALVVIAAVWLIVIFRHVIDDQ